MVDSIYGLFLLIYNSICWLDKEDYGIIHAIGPVKMEKLARHDGAPLQSQ